jgi:hypothetical protein
VTSMITWGKQKLFKKVDLQVTCTWIVFFWVLETWSLQHQFPYKCTFDICCFIFNIWKMWLHLNCSERLSYPVKLMFFRLAGFFKVGPKWIQAYNFRNCVVGLLMDFFLFHEFTPARALHHNADEKYKLCSPPVSQ